MDLFFRFKKNNEELELLEPADRVVVGVSGGADSIVLLDLLAKLQEELALTILVVHVNYGLRGEESDDDEKFVGELAKKYGTKFKVKQYHPHPEPSPVEGEGNKKKNFQSEARDFRYDFFNKIDANKIALAHHADDQVETILLHLIRGSGSDGLEGMSHKSGKIVRPLLKFKKEELLKYAKENGLSFREDSSNKTSKYARNLLRNEILPILKRENPNLTDHVTKTAQIIRDEGDVLNEIVAGVIEEICQERDGCITFDRSGFADLHKAIKRRVIRSIFKRINGSSKDLLSDHVERIIQISDGGEKEGFYSLPNDLEFRREADDLMIYRKC